MKLEQLLTALNNKKISLQLDNGKVKVFDQDKNLDDELVKWLKHYKPEIVQWLSQGKGFTASDFSYSKLSSEQISDIESRYPNLQRLYIATPMQTGFIFHGMLDGAGTSYTTQIYCDLVGEIDSKALHGAWQTVLQRHDILRTCFVGLDSNQIHQLVCNNVILSLHEEDWRQQEPSGVEEQLANWRKADQEKGFDFAQAPLMRISLIRVGNNKYHFVWSHHHVLLDGWCAPIIFEEVMSCYKALSNGETPDLGTTISYENYISWLFRKDNEMAKSYWQNHLKGFTSPTNIPHKIINKNLQSIDVQKIYVALPQEYSDKIAEMAKAAHCTINVVMQLAWSYVLQRYTGKDDVVFGSTVSGRPAELQGVETMMGLFINSIPVRVQLSSEATLRDIFAQIQKDNVDRNEHSYLPLAEVQKVCDVENGTALFDSLLVFENYPTNEAISDKANQKKNSFQVENLSANSNNNLGISVIAHFQNAQLQYEIAFQTAQFEPDMMQRLAKHLEQVLIAISKVGLDSRLENLNMLSEVETRQLVHQWNNNEKEYPKDVGLHRLFEQQVVQTPDAIALQYKDIQVTYQELNEQANQFAHYLLENGEAPGKLIGLCMDRSIEMMVAMLGIMKSGSAYVPLDIKAPESRITHILHDCGASLLVTQTHLSSQLPVSDSRHLCLDEGVQSSSLSTMPKSNIGALDAEANSIAYAIYTSGSTGQPKGVLIQHRSLVNFICAGKDAFLQGLIKGSVVSSPVAFDATVQSLFIPLIAGLYVRLLPEEALPIESLSDCLFNSTDALLFKITPAHLKALYNYTQGQTAPYARHVLVVAGEQLTSEVIFPWLVNLPNCQFINEYGPTEATVGTTIFNINNVETLPAPVIPIGKPLTNAQCYVLDSQHHLVPLGCVGELYIGGAGLAEGYLNQPELTAEKFITNTNVNIPAQRLYRTGDLVKRLNTGDLEYIGRIDNQVKLRGFRIELGEIEVLLSAIAGVDHAAVIVWQGSDAEARLVAYVVVNELQYEQDELLRKARTSMLIDQYQAELKKHLPDYMLPANYVFLNTMPLSPNGKVDRKALPAPELSDIQKEKYVAPENEIEEQLCKIWEEVLKIPKVGIQDNFIALGGDSIISIQVVSMARQQGLFFGVRDLLEQLTIEALAPFVSTEEIVSAPQGEVTGVMPLLPIQIQFFEMNLPVPNHYNQSVLLEAPVALTESDLHKLITAIYSRHDALRLRFNQTGEKLETIYMPFNRLMIVQSIEVFELNNPDEADWRNQVEQHCERLQGSLNIQNGPLFKAALFRINGERNVLLFVMHHLIVDGVSWRILLNDLEYGWGQLAQGGEIQLRPKSNSFQQWGEKVHQYAKSDLMRKERNYWVQKMSSSVTPIPKSMKTRTKSERDFQTARFQLTEKETTFLLGECNKAYRTQINELLLTGLLKAYKRWLGGEAMLLKMESHGREELFDNCDVGETVGWFTSIYPLILSSGKTEDIGDLIKAVKDQYREVPNNGIGYGILKHINNDQEVIKLDQALPEPAIKFNYMGQLDKSVNQDTQFQTARGLSSGHSVHPENNPPAVMSVSCDVYQGQLGVKTTLGQEYQDIRGFSEALEQALQEIIVRCGNVNQKKELQESSKVFATDSSELAEKGIQI
ncbi:amino acid adenylation domain-containing protein [Paraneptunicella aestuarii]|uniref:non-ribosomal peptide synthetase n=1 Tax=Paraneptunicella aestuarii TaxID=2831148 RepID=UPI001E5381FE|nr:non-ribosomal peptide synthetase [Paraneptunicella aestuarii]UAA37203.1 amino acid adenylation domain-containing protein [Paraneptunicella aestuarii]